ncbi:uncharacterized protein EDB91DRAFT_1087370 [Suillus paluster]|uniref:uncharacterized protein n=1 Tax=Suillus paluster TaxID=48578 RepID=UPI001B8666D6|nr:uncharacterized protein EDB91DRAFT_1087370 [Suillus paluster]KAG1724699.1 hypothetical protein EDB91DRAFT_1087370 [Suillus paluster]
MSSIRDNNSILNPPSGTAFSDFLSTWNDGHVARWLTNIHCSAFIETFRNHGIRGDLLLEIDQDILKDMGVTSIGDRLRIVNGVKGLRNRCLLPDANPSVSAIAHSRPSMSSLEIPPREPRITNATFQSHSRLPPRESSSNRPDLSHIIRERRYGGSICNAPAIPPPPQTRPSGQSTTLRSDTITRSSSLPLSPARPPRPPTTRAGPRTLDPLIIPHTRTPKKAHPANHANSPLSPAPTSAGSNTQTISPVNSQSNRWSTCSFGLPANPRSPPPNMKHQIRSPTPPVSRPPPCAANLVSNRNISFNSITSPRERTPTEGNLAPRPSTPGTFACPSARAPTSRSLRTPGQHGFPLSPIIESSRSSSRSSSTLTASLRRRSFNPASHAAAPSLDELRHKLVKFIMPEEGQSYVVDVADCADGIEIVEKVLKKAEKAGLRRNDASDVMGPVNMDGGGFNVDGWSVYLEWDDANDSGDPLSEAELQAVCHSSSYYSVKVRGLTLRKKTKRSKDLHQMFGENPPRSLISSTPRVLRPRSPEPDIAAYARAISELQSKKSRTIKGATTISVRSVHDPPSLLQGRPKKLHPSANSVKKHPKLRSFLRHGAMVAAHLTGHFPFVEGEVLCNARRGMVLCASDVSGDKSGPPLPSRFSASTHGSKLEQGSRISVTLTGLWESMKRSQPYKGPV